MDDKLCKGLNWASYRLILKAEKNNSAIPAPAPRAPGEMECWNIELWFP